MLTSARETKGSAWLEKNSGRLVKSTINRDYADNAGNAGKEYYEGEVAPQ